MEGSPWKALKEAFGCVGELVGYIQAYTHAGFAAELDEGAVDKEVVKALPPKCHGKGAWSGE